MPTRSRPSLPVSATEWIASANMLADPDSAAAANLITATQEFEINAATTLRREPRSERSPAMSTLYPGGRDYCADAVGRGVGSAARPRGGEGFDGWRADQLRLASPDPGKRHAEGDHDPTVHGCDRLRHQLDRGL